MVFENTENIILVFYGNCYSSSLNLVFSVFSKQNKKQGTNRIPMFSLFLRTKNNLKKL